MVFKTIFIFYFFCIRVSFTAGTLFSHNRKRNIIHEAEWCPKAFQFYSKNESNFVFRRYFSLAQQRKRRGFTIGSRHSTYEPDPLVSLIQQFTLQDKRTNIIAVLRPRRHGLTRLLKWPSTPVLDPYVYRLHSQCSVRLPMLEVCAMEGGHMDLRSVS